MNASLASNHGDISAHDAWQRARQAREQGGFPRAVLIA